MPEKRKSYRRVIFTPEVIKNAVNAVEVILHKKSVPGRYEISTSSEGWKYNNGDEFFTDYIKGFESASILKMYNAGSKGIFHLSVNKDETNVSIALSSRSEVERAFSIFEANVDKCRLPKQPKEKSNVETDWVTENINKIEVHCPLVARKLKLALLKLNSEDAEEWQNATMLIRDAWIELSQWLCLVKDIDTSDIPSDSVIDRLKKLNMDKIDERLFNLARASFGLYGKHHKRDIDLDTAVACVISTVVSMKTVIVEVLNA